MFAAERFHYNSELYLKDLRNLPLLSLHKKWSFLLRISSVDVTYFLLKKFLMENFIFCTVYSEIFLNICSSLPQFLDVSNQSPNCVRIGSFFYYIFSHIQTEYGGIQIKYPYSLRIPEYMDQKTPNSYTFHYNYVSS